MPRSTEKKNVFISAFGSCQKTLNCAADMPLYASIVNKSSNAIDLPINLNAIKAMNTQPVPIRFHPGDPTPFLCSCVRPTTTKTKLPNSTKGQKCIISNIEYGNNKMYTQLEKSDFYYEIFDDYLMGQCKVLL